MQKVTRRFRVTFQRNYDFRRNPYLEQLNQSVVDQVRTAEGHTVAIYEIETTPRDYLLSTRFAGNPHILSVEELRGT